MLDFVHLLNTVDICCARSSEWLSCNKQRQLWKAGNVLGPAFTETTSWDDTKDFQPTATFNFI